MSTICSAICKAMRVGDNTVGTSTNCSAELRLRNHENEHGYGQQ